MFFDAPYRSLFFARDELAECMRSASPGSFLQAKLSELLAFIKGYFSKAIAAQAEQRRTGRIQYDQLWTLFPVGELVYQKTKSPHDDTEIEQVSTVDTVIV